MQTRMDARAPEFEGNLQKEEEAKKAITLEMEDGSTMLEVIRRWWALFRDSLKGEVGKRAEEGEERLR